MRNAADLSTHPLVVDEVIVLLGVGKSPLVLLLPLAHLAEVSASASLYAGGE